MAHVRRLLSDVTPARYCLGYEIDAKTWEFSLQESIDFALGKASDCITFHSVDLDIHSARLDGKHSGAISFDAQAQTVSFTFDQKIASGEHRLQLEMTGPIQDSLHGFYRSQYQQPDGATSWFLMTQFEAIHAREAFVCIDEPSAKAVFELALDVPEGVTVLGNTPVAKHTVRSGRQMVSFEPTPKMSTYLLAWVISKLVAESTTSAHGTVITIYGAPAHGKHLAYAADFARRSLDFYEDYFALNYPLPKLDLVACPNFASGAMENWGLITYRETDLVVDPEHTSISNQQRVAVVIAHELAHMWFGDLVTMSWWEDLWLNESFATWAETMAVDALEPSWEWWANDTAGQATMAREIDSLANTHPILVEVPDPKGLDEIFDAISYFKGQGLVRMLEHYLGSEVFREGIRIYVKRHAYRNTATDDLWAALRDASGVDVAKLMHAWTSLPGYPILTYDGGFLRQERFIASPQEARKLHIAQSPVSLWPIPLAAVTSEGVDQLPEVMDSAEQELPEAWRTATWYKPNPEETGFFRSVYTHDMIASLRQPLRDQELSVSDRFGVVSDVWVATSAGRTASKTALELTAALRDEPAYIAALAVYDGLGGLLGIVEDEAMRSRLERFGRWLAEPNYTRLGWVPVKGESHFDTLLRAVAIVQALRFDIPGAQAEALQRFADYVKGSKLDPNLRAAIFYGAARYGDHIQYDQLLQLYRHEQAPHTRQSQLVNLGRFTQPDLVKRTLEFAMSDAVKSQDLVYGLAGVWRARENRDLAWQFMRDNWDELVRRFGEGGHMLDRFPDLPGSAFATHAKAHEVGKFFAAHPHVLITRPVAQAVEAIELKADWFERDHAAIAAFLHEWEAEHPADWTT